MSATSLSNFAMISATLRQASGRECVRCRVKALLLACRLLAQAGLDVILVITAIKVQSGWTMEGPCLVREVGIQDILKEVMHTSRKLRFIAGCVKRIFLAGGRRVNRLAGLAAFNRRPPSPQGADAVA